MTDLYTSPETAPPDRMTTSSMALAAFKRLADVPPEIEWFANIANPCTRRAYQSDLKDFTAFFGIDRPEQFRQVTRAHVIAWRNDLIARKPKPAAPATLRRKLAALSSLFDYLCERNAVDDNPTHGVQRLREESYEGKTPALSDEQARRLLDAPSEHTLKGKRDRAILAILLYHGLRRDELCKLKIGDIQMRDGINQFCVHGKGGKIRYIPVHPAAATRIFQYLASAPHTGSKESPLFVPVKRATSRALSTTAVYKNVVMYYADKLEIELPGVSPHALRATAATNALEHSADITEVQHWLGHARIDTTRLYDKRRRRAENSPTFKVSY